MGWISFGNAKIGHFSNVEYSALKDTTFAAAYHCVLIDRKEIELYFSCFDLLKVLMVVCNEDGFLCP